MRCPFCDGDGQIWGDLPSVEDVLFKLKIARMHKHADERREALYELEEALKKYKEEESEE